MNRNDVEWNATTINFRENRLEVDNEGGRFPLSFILQYYSK